MKMAMGWVAAGCHGRPVLPVLMMSAMALGWSSGAAAQVVQTGRLEISVEGLTIWQQRNDVRIPPQTGTEFSIVDLIGSAPTPSVRTEVILAIGDRQELRFVHAPVRITGRGTSGASIAFAGADFSATEPTDAEFKFTSYRGTWRYRVFQGDTWTWRVGITGFVRDARIALSQPGRSAEDTDIGFVPLGHVRGDARLSARWHLSLELDGTAAPQGRAFDFAIALNYRPVPRLTVSAGYRTIEGGADVDAVYTFAWLNAAFAKVGVRF
jgi:hypothetical protein